MRVPRFRFTDLTDCCTTEDRMIHLIVHNALSTWVVLATGAGAL